MAKKQENKDSSITSFEEEKLFLEERKVKALEKIGNTLDALTIWFEEIDKAGWDERMQYYLHEFHKNFITSDDKEDESE